MSLLLLLLRHSSGAVAPSADHSFRLEAKKDGVTWSELDDVLVPDDVEFFLGIDGDEPEDITAEGGELRFSMRNDAGNSVATEGAYSPGHPSCLSWWNYYLPVRAVFTVDGVDTVRWTGEIGTLDPDTAPFGPKRVRVVAYDGMHKLLEATLRSISPQVGLSESAVLGNILDALPAEAQPVARSIATGLDTFSYALGDLQPDASALTAIHRVNRSSWGRVYCDGTGTFVYKTRQTVYTTASSATLEDDIDELVVPASREGLYNVVRATVRPPRTASVTLWADDGDEPTVVRAGDTITPQTPYRDPNQKSVRIGAASVTPPVSGVDYIGNDTADGSGVDLTSTLVVSAAANSALAAWSIANPGAQDIFLTPTWQIRGVGIFRDIEQAVEARSSQGYGERSCDLNLYYQDSAYVARGLCNLIKDQREDETKLVSSVSFYADTSTDTMDLAMAVEPTSVITINNSLRGMSGALAEVRRVHYTVSHGGILRVTLGLTPTSSLTTPPSTPTGLAVSTYSDTQLSATWTNTDVTADTEVYVDGALATIAQAGATSAIVGGLTRATAYTVTLKHIKYAMLRSSATAGVTGRPHVVATGGTITTVGGFKIHTFTTSSSFVITGRGRVSFALVAGGGGGGASDRFDGQIAGGGGGGGGVLQVTDTDEPAGTYAVVIGAGGAGAVAGTSSQAGANGGDTTYRSNAGVGGGGGGCYGVAGGFGSSQGSDGGNGGGGSGEGGAGGTGTQGYNGGAGGIAGSLYRTGGGGGGAGGAGGAGTEGGGAGSVGGAAGAGVTLFGASGYSAGAQGGGPSGANGASAGSYGCAGAGIHYGDGGNGFQGIAIFRYPI